MRVIEVVGVASMTVNYSFRSAVTLHSDICRDRDAIPIGLNTNYNRNVELSQF